MNKYILCGMYRKSITNTLNALTISTNDSGTINGEECSIGSAGSLAGKKNRSAFEDDLSCELGFIYFLLLSLRLSNFRYGIK